MSLFKKKIKVLVTKLVSLESELKTCKDLATSASIEVEAMFDKEHGIENKKYTTKKEEQEEKDKSDSKKECKNKTLLPTSAKKVFRKIALQTHPDKLLSSKEETKQEKIHLYQRAVRAAEEGDVLILADIAIDLGIEPPEINEEHIKNAQDKINSIKKQINHLESTYVWKWFFCDDQKLKNQILKKIFQIIYEQRKKNNPRT